MFILKHAFQNDEFLTACVGVWGKMTAGRISDDGGGAGDFITNPIQHAPINTCHRGGNPEFFC